MWGLELETQIRYMGLIYTRRVGNGKVKLSNSEYFERQIKCLRPKYSILGGKSSNSPLNKFKRFISFINLEFKWLKSVLISYTPWIESLCVYKVGLYWYLCGMKSFMKEGANFNPEDATVSPRNIWNEEIHRGLWKIMANFDHR